MKFRISRFHLVGAVILFTAALLCLNGCGTPKEEGATETPQTDFEIIQTPEAQQAESSEQAEESRIKKIHGSDEYLAFLESAPVTLVDFTATWCGPCGRLAPILEKMSASYEKDNVKFAKVDVDENEQMVGTLGVSGIPDVRIFVNGKKFGQIIGCQPQEIMMKLEEAIKSTKKSDAPQSAEQIPAESKKPADAEMALPPLPTGPLPVDPSAETPAVPAAEPASAEMPVETPTSPAEPVPVL